MLVDLQRKRFKEFDDKVSQLNVKMDALNKRDLKRQQQFRNTSNC